MTKNKKAEEIAFSRCDVPERTKRFALQYVSEAYAGIKNCRECEFYNTCIRIDSVRAELRKKKKEGMKNMTEQETREKIVGIITHEYVTDKDYAYIFDPRIEEKINNMADALIAAGIGDLKEHRIFAGKDGSIKQLYSGEEVEKIVKEREEYKHRAEVAERALDLCETAYILSLNHRATEGVSGRAIASDLGIHKFFMEQAENELAEEGKDD